MASSSQEPQSEKQWNLQSNPFKLLGVDLNSSLDPEKIRKAFKDRIRNIHPDKNDGKESLAKKITAAYNFLKNADAKKLKELAEIFSSFNYKGGMKKPPQDVSNVILDQTKSDQYRRIFNSHFKFAKETKFKDNFGSFYKQVFDKIETLPEVPVGYRCGVCKEDYICMEDHTKLIFSPYVDYMKEQINALEDDVKGMEGYLGKIFSSDEHLISPLNIEWNTGNWSEDEKIIDFMNQWIDFFKAIENPDKIDASYLRFGLKIMLRNETSASIKSISGGLNKLDKDKLIYAVVKLIESLMKMREQDPAEIYSALRTFQPMGNEVGKLTLIDFILPAFLKHYKEMADWSKFIVKDPWMNARLAVIVARLGVIFNSRKKSYLKLGLSLVGNSCPDGACYGHLCFLLGSLDIDGVTLKILQSSDNPEARKLAAHYFLKMEKTDELKDVGLALMSTLDVGGATVVLYILTMHHLQEGNFDKAFETADIFISKEEVWKCMLHHLKENPSSLLESVMVALRTLNIVEDELTKIGETQADGRFVGRHPRLSKLIKVLCAAVHVLEWTKKFNSREACSEVPDFFVTALKMQDYDAMLASLRFPHMDSGLQKFLEKMRFLDSSNIKKIEPGSHCEAFFTFMRGLYNYKMGNYKGMSDDFVTSYIISKNPEIWRTIGAFLASNPMIHEKLLKETCSAFKRVKNFIEKYTGKESFKTSSFPELLQNTEADTKPFLSKVFEFNTKDLKTNDVAYLEKDILGRNKDNAPMSPGDYAKRGYSYVDLEMLSPAIGDVVSCHIMAAHHFLQAMIATPAQNIEEKYAYRALVLESVRQLEKFSKPIHGEPVVSLYSTRVMQSFILQANYLFSRVLHENKSKCDIVKGIGFIEEGEVGMIREEWQNLLNFKILSPLISPKIYTIAEGIIAISSMLLMDQSLLLQKIWKESFSLNVPQYLYHQYQFYILWLGNIRLKEFKYKGDDAYENVETEETKRLRMVNVEKETKTPEGVPLVKREVFLRAKETSMDLLAEAFGYDLAEVEKMMRWHCIRRTEKGFIDVGNRTLDFDKQLYSYSKFVGVEFFPETGICSFLLEPASASQPGLFSAVDIYEIFGFQIEDAVIHFAEQFYVDANGREAEAYARLPIPGIPFFKTRFVGYGPEGCESKERICGTNFLMTLYHLDLLAKMLTTGQEVSAHFPFHQQSTEEGLLNNLSAEMKKILKPVGERSKVIDLKIADIVHMFWFHVGEVEQYIDRVPTMIGEAFQFRYGEVKMSLFTSPMASNDDGSLEAVNPLDKNGPEEQFCRDFNKNWKKIEKIFPILNRTKELAKIAAAFKILRNNRKHCEGMVGYDSLLRINKPCTRPYSKCRWEGSVKKSSPCSCTPWVPAVFGISKVTKEQKLEYLKNKNFSKNKRSDKTATPEDSMKKLTLKENDPESKEEEELGTVKVIRDEKGQGSCSMNLNDYDQIEQYKIYGGVQFEPKVKNVPFLPPRGERVSAETFLSKNGPPGFDRVPEPKGPRIPMSSKALPTPSPILKEDTDVVSQTSIYSIVPVGKEGSLWEGKVGITSVKKENGDLPGARWEVEKMNREAVQKGLDDRYEYVKLKNSSAKKEAE